MPSKRSPVIQRHCSSWPVAVPINAESHVHTMGVWVDVRQGDDIHAHSWYARASLPCNRFLFHINCNMIVSNKCSSHFTSFFYSKAYFLDFSTSITSLQTNPAIFRLLGSCSPGYIIIHSSKWFDTTIRCVNDNTTQQYESVPKHLAISQHILVDSTAGMFSPPRDKILAQLA